MLLLANWLVIHVLIYVRFLDDVDNIGADRVNTIMSVTYTDSDFEVFAPYITIDR